MQELVEKLIAFKTTEDNPEEIKKGFEYIASLFDKEKYEVQWFEKDGKFSLLVSFKGQDALHPKILLNGHFDVVPPESEEQFRMRVEGNKAYGRGTFDMKGMVAVLIEVMLEAGKEANPPHAAMLLNGDEEIGGEKGAGYLAHEVGLKPEFVICPDAGSQKFEIVTKEKGILWIELLSKGVGAHGAFLWLGENAIEKLMGAIFKVKQFIGPVEADAWKTTVNVGVIETSNKTPNKVPADARAVLDIRFTEAMAQTPEELKQKIQNLIPEVEVRVLEQSGMFFVQENNELVQKFKTIAEQVTGQEVEFSYEHGAADIRFFGDMGVPGVLFGALGEGMHSAGEWVDLTSLEKGKKIIVQFLKEA